MIRSVDDEDQHAPLIRTPGATTKEPTSIPVVLKFKAMHSLQHAMLRQKLGHFLAAASDGSLMSSLQQSYTARHDGCNISGFCTQRERKWPKATRTAPWRFWF